MKLSYRLLGSAFHDGTRTTEADLLYAYMFAYRWGAQGDAARQTDPAVVAATAPLRQRLAAIRVAGVDTAAKSFRVADMNFVRELFLVDVYADMPPGDAEQDAVFAPPWSTLPWHLTVLMEEAVASGWAAFSREEAARLGVEWLDLVRSDALKTRLLGLVDRFEREGFRPASLQPLVGEEEARKRWAALAAFYRSHGHFLVTNGPCQLKSWSADSATLDVFRDLSYPLGVGSFDTYAIPRRGYIVKVERRDRGLVLSADIEIVMKFMRDYEIVRQPMHLVDAVIRRRAAPECRYVVVDAAGRIALVGTALPQEDLTIRGRARRQAAIRAIHRHGRDCHQRQCDEPGDRAHPGGDRRTAMSRYRRPAVRLRGEPGEEGQAGVGAAGWRSPAWRRSVHKAAGIGWRSSARFARNSSALRGPGMIAATAGCASGNCRAAAASGTLWVSQTAPIALTRATISGGAVR